MAFYHEVKEHMSPSALAQWLGGRGQFTRSYFAGEKTPETSAMKEGTKIHALIEAGIIKAKHVYSHGEEEITMQVPGTDFYFMGRPDSFSDVSKEGSYVQFVDYKSGKLNSWQEKLPFDIKMRATAWLVWMHTGKPQEVQGHIEFIQTTWDPEQRKIVLIEGKETEMASIAYSRQEMVDFTGVIVNAMHDVNDFFEKWKQSTGEFVNLDDVRRAVELRNEISEREMELDEVEGRILSQMEFGGEENHKTEYGTFFLKRSKTYEYPASLKINYLNMGLFLEDAESIAAATKAAKANYELINEPKEVKIGISFRPAKK